jgi:hypothetical protein
VSALAYTVGSNIVFGQGRYSPGSETGRRLLAHELTHVLQQSSDDLAIQREEAKFDVDGTAGEVEKLVCSTEIEDGEHQALVKLDAIVDTKNLLNVTAKLYDTWEATQNPRPLKPGEPAPATCTAFAELNADLKTDNEATKKAKAGLSAEQLNRLMAAFDAARVHKLRNPISEQDKGTSPHSFRGPGAVGPRQKARAGAHRRLGRGSSGQHLGDALRRHSDLLDQLGDSRERVAFSPVAGQERW